MKELRKSFCAAGQLAERGVFFTGLVPGVLISFAETKVAPLSEPFTSKKRSFNDGKPSERIVKSLYQPCFQPIRLITPNAFRGYQKKFGRLEKISFVEKISQKNNSCLNNLLKGK